MSSQLSKTKGDRTESVAIADITRKHTQLRVKMDPQAVEDYADEYRNFKDCSMPPIVIFEDDDAYEWNLGDGYHRCEAALRAGRANIDAIIKKGTLDDAILFAASTNSHNAVRWSGADKVKAVRTLKERFPKMVQRDVAKACGCSQGFVSEVLNGKRDDRGNKIAEDEATGSSSRPAKTTLDKFADAAEKAERYFDALIDEGLIEVTSVGTNVPADAAPHLNRIVVIAETLGMQRPSRSDDHDDQPDEQTVEAEVVESLPEPDDFSDEYKAYVADDDQYEDVGDDAPTQGEEDPAKAIAGLLDDALRDGKTPTQVMKIMVDAFTQQISGEPIAKSRRSKRKIRELLPSPLSKDQAEKLIEDVKFHLNPEVAA